jgi:hypothetical protein
MAITKVTNRVLDVNSVSTAQLSAGAVTTKLGSEIGAFGFRNKVINGDMRIDQRNSGEAVNSVNDTRRYPVDRMAVDVVGTGNITCQQVTDAPVGFQYSSRLTLTTPNTNPLNLDRMYILHVIEGSNIANVGFNRAWCKSQVLTFWVKSSIPGKYTVTFFYGLNNERRHILPYSINTSNTWEFKTLVLPPDISSGINPNITNGVGLIATWSLGGASTWRTGTSPNVWYTEPLAPSGPWMLSDAVQWLSSSAGATWQIAGVQLEEGSVATPFEQRPIGTELALCQRYYWRPNPTGGAGVSTASQANIVNFFITYPTTMRVTPQVIDANDPPRFTPLASYLNVSCQPVNGYNCSWTALNAEL